MNLRELRIELEKDPEYNKESRKHQFHYEFAKAVLHARLDRGLSQAKLADLVGTKQANISKIESGQSNITADLIGRISGELGLFIFFFNSEKVSQQIFSVSPEREITNTQNNDQETFSYQNNSTEEHEWMVEV